MSEVTIGDTTYDVYADDEETNEYALAATHGTPFTSASADLKKQAVVTATRILDRQKWLTTHNTFALRAAEPQIVDAMKELAIALVTGTDVQNEANQSQKIAALQAGSVSIQYFRGAEGSAARFPQIIMELIAEFLAGADFSYGGFSSGTCGESILGNDFGHTDGQ